MTATVEEFQQTLASYEDAAIATGEWDGADAVEFSADGQTWSPVWIATLDQYARDIPFPKFARARVHRRGVLHADWRYLSWEESVPAAEDWRTLWERKPMKLFGAYALRDAIRHAFRDVIGDRRDADELDPAGPITSPAAEAPARDWDKEIAEAASSEALTAIWAEARTERARTGAREVAYEARLAELEAAEADAWGEPATPAPRPQLRDHLPASSSATKRKKKRGRR